MEEKFIELGGEKFKITINFRNCYKLTKYRNKMETNIDFSKADKDLLDEFSSVELNEDGSFPFEKLSMKAKQFAMANIRDSRTIFSEEEIFDIVKTLTGVENEDRILDLLNKEVETNEYDVFIDKLVNGISMVFTRAKDGSQQKELNKQNLNKIAK